MARRLTRLAAGTSIGCALIWIIAGAAFAKGPDQAIVTGPGIEHPIAVRVRGTPTIGPDMAAMVESSAIMEQLWCRACDDLAAKQPHATLGPMYVVRYRLPSFTGGGTRWVEQRVYPFARPQPLTYVARGQPFDGVRTVGGWYQSDARLRHLLVGLGVPRPAPAGPVVVDTAPATPVWVSIAVIAAAVALLAAVVGGLILLGRGWSHSSKTNANPA